MNKIKIIVALALIIIVVLILCFFNNNKKVKEEIKIVNKIEVIKDQNIDGIEMTNTSLIIVDNISKLVTKVTNNTNNDYQLNEYEITVKDKNGIVLAIIPGYVGNVIKKGETKEINSSIDIDLSNAESISYSIKK